MDDFDEIIKLLILGDCSVGKTNLLKRYCNNSFDENSKTTIGVDFLNKEIIKNNLKYLVRIYDTAGQEKFKAIVKGLYKGTNGLIIVFDLTNRDSFENVTKWFEDAKLSINQNFTSILVGNKNDLVNLRQITEEEGKEKAKTLEMSYIETSAKTSSNVEQAFSELITVVIDKLIKEENIEENSHGEKIELGKGIYKNVTEIKNENNNNNQKEKKGCC